MTGIQSLELATTTSQGPYEQEAGVRELGLVQTLQCWLNHTVTAPGIFKISTLMFKFQPGLKHPQLISHSSIQIHIFCPILHKPLMALTYCIKLE